MKSGRTPTTEEIEYIYKLLDEPPGDFDCGKLCMEEDGPLCCVTDNAVPSVYRWEWKYLKKRTKMWHRWRPRNEQERKDFMDFKTECDIYVECDGAANCDRRYRSFVCRTFPLEPYVENDWDMSGLIFNTDFEGKCPLVEKHAKLRRQYIEACIVAWQWLLGAEPEMREVYRDWSQALRRRCGQLDLPVRGFDLDGRWTTLRPRRSRR